jgi:hypothetical protein
MPSTHTIEVLVNGARGSRRRGPGLCRGCQATIVWCATAAGKPMPFDEMPDPISVDGDVETVSTEFVHWSRCPKAADFKRPAPATTNDLVQPRPKAQSKDPGFEW